MAVKNSKGKLIDFLAQNHMEKVKFTSKTIGPAHKPTFETKVIFNSQEIAKAKASTKRQAEHKAAEIAIKFIQQLELSNNQDIDDEFMGPWPVFPQILVKCLEIANEHQNKKANNRLEQIQTNTLKLYKGLLADLGEVVEDD